MKENDEDDGQPLVDVVVRTMAERVSSLEQWTKDNIRTQARRFSENEKAHDKLMNGLEKNAEEHKAIKMVLEDIKSHLTHQDLLFTRYNWLARGVMLGFFIAGAFGGMFLSKEGVKLFIGLIQSLAK